MAKPYLRDLRERMVRAVQAGRSRHEVARMFEVSASCVIKLMRRYETTGDCAPGKFGGHKRSALIGFEDKVRALCRRDLGFDQHDAPAMADAKKARG
jgi:transposase